MTVKILKVTSETQGGAIPDMHLKLYAGGYRVVPKVVLGSWWILYVDGSPAGFAGVRRSASWEKTAYLCRVGVLEEHQGRGFQKKLIRVREKWAREKGLAWVITDTWTDNPASSNSLISCGYKLWIPSQKWAGYSPALYWRKKL